MSRGSLEAPQGVIRIYSQRLIAALEAAGFSPTIRHHNCDATFTRNDTLNRVITEYVDARDRERALAEYRQRKSAKAVEHGA
jgi:hypothetical protein